MFNTKNLKRCLKSAASWCRRIAGATAYFPVAAAWQDQILSLPMYPEMSEQDVDYVCRSVREFFTPELHSDRSLALSRNGR